MRCVPHVEAPHVERAGCPAIGAFSPSLESLTRVASEVLCRSMPERGGHGDGWLWRVVVVSLGVAGTIVEAGARRGGRDAGHASRPPRRAWSRRAASPRRARAHHASASDENGDVVEPRSDVTTHTPTSSATRAPNSSRDAVAALRTPSVARST